MNESQDRIDRFRKMAEADPENELGHFSLGRALADAAQHEEAVRSYMRVLAINPKLSKVYQLLAHSLLQLGRRDEAVAQLTAGVKTADQRGDLMPKNEMIRMLQDLGAPLPELGKPVAPDRPLDAGEVLCKRCGRIGPKLPSPPFRNAQGAMIQENTCAPCWREWIGMGTKVINEMRLPLSDPQAQKIFDQQMMEFLNLSKA